VKPFLNLFYESQLWLIAPPGQLNRCTSFSECPNERLTKNMRLRRRVAELARGTLGGNIDVLEGLSRIVSLRDELDIDRNDDDLLPFVVVEAIVTMFDDVTRFTTAGQVGAYIGMVPNQRIQRHGL